MLTADPDQAKETKTASEIAKGFFANYSEYNKQLRTWFVTFGLGGPALFLSKPELLEPLTASWRHVVVWAFLGGCLFQVAIALINKYLSWVEYAYQECVALEADRQRTAFEAWCETISSKVWIDLVADLITVAAFALAVVGLAMGALTIAAPVAIETGPLR